MHVGPNVGPPSIISAPLVVSNALQETVHDILWKKFSTRGAVLAEEGNVLLEHIPFANRPFRMPRAYYRVVEGVIQQNCLYICHGVGEIGRRWSLITF